MLSVEETLLKIQKQLRNTEDAYSVIFEINDIKTLSSKVALGMLKIKYRNNMKESMDTKLSVEEVHNVIKNDDDFSYVLRYCILRNKLLEESIGVIFPYLMEEYDNV